MRRHLHAPCVGERTTSTWGREVSGFAREKAAVGGLGMKTASGSLGTIIRPREDYVMRSPYFGQCFDIVYDIDGKADGEEGETVVRGFFERRYFGVGGMVKECTDRKEGFDRDKGDEGDRISVDTFVLQGQLPAGSKPDDYTEGDLPMICLQVTATSSPLARRRFVYEKDGKHFEVDDSGTTIVGFKDYLDFASHMGDLDYYYIPLYLLDHAGNVMVDFRTMPVASMGELI